MIWPRGQQRAWTWVALLAIWMAALAPTVSHALARAEGAAAPPAGWIEVCTASGMQWIKLDGSAPQDGEAPASVPPAHGLLKHCPFCLLTADHLGLPPHPACQRCVGGDSVAPAAGLVFFYRPLSYLAALARGPPLDKRPLSVA